ncbi:MAG: hypothetical protein WD696_00445 [Bryobacteraceae bacterium]
MRSTTLSAAIVLLATLAIPGRAPAQGVAAEWDFRKTLEEIAAYTKRLDSVLDQLKPKEWVLKGASETYVSQWTISRDQGQALAQSGRELHDRPEKLTVALDMYFRLDALNTRLGSLSEGVRNYHNPAVADLLLGIVSENSACTQRLRQYVVDLAALKEDEFKVADQEAQRCRGFLSRQPAQAKPRTNPERK